VRSRGTWPGGRRALAVVALALAGGVAASTLAGCTSVRDDLGTASSGCYVALPIATSAVGDQGRLHGVRLVGVPSLRGGDSLLYRAAVSAPPPRVARVCLVAFTGQFQADGVAQPIGRSEGRVAVVELAYPDNRLLATLLIARPPLAFGHSHLGVL
jgi:hypothetical protein